MKLAQVYRCERWALTLDAIVDFGKCSLACELNFVGDDIANSRVPVHSQGVVTSVPFSTDVCIYLHAMCVSIVRSCRNRVVRKWERLVDEIGRLALERQNAVLGLGCKDQTHFYWT